MRADDWVRGLGRGNAFPQWRKPACWLTIASKDELVRPSYSKGQLAVPSTSSFGDAAALRAAADSTSPPHRRASLCGDSAPVRAKLSTARQMCATVIIIITFSGVGSGNVPCSFLGGGAQERSAELSVNRKPENVIIIITVACIDETCAAKRRTDTVTYCHPGWYGYRTTLPGTLGTMVPRVHPTPYHPPATGVMTEHGRAVDGAAPWAQWPRSPAGRER